MSLCLSNKAANSNQAHVISSHNVTCQLQLSECGVVRPTSGMLCRPLSMWDLSSTVRSAWLPSDGEMVHTLLLQSGLATESQPVSFQVQHNVLISCGDNRVKSTEMVWPGSVTWAVIRGLMVWIPYRFKDGLCSSLCVCKYYSAMKFWCFQFN